MTELVRVESDRYRATMQCCPDRANLCERCIDDAFSQLRGTAACRGERWAARVARVRGVRHAWPPHAGRAAAIALRKVEDLTADPRLREKLAAELATWARRRWEALAVALV